MATTNHKTICVRDCYSNCGLIVTVQDGKAVSLKGDPDHPYNQGVVCPKSRRFLELVYSDRRLKRPLLKEKGRFTRVSWDKALDILADKLSETKERYGPLSIYHHTDYAHSGILHNNVDLRFFNAFGGSSRASGSLCLSGGLAALDTAFGGRAVSDHGQLEKAGLIILWGSNPKVTNVPLLPYLRAARKKGAKVYLIDPIRTESACIADACIQPVPGSDVELALGLAKCLIRRGAYDYEFACRYSEGFDSFMRLVSETDPVQVEATTGLAWATIEKLAGDLADRFPLTIIAGWGLQRHHNGPLMIRALSNLVALTGSIGEAGGGLQYAHGAWRALGDISGESEFDYQERLFPRGKVGSALLSADPPIQVAVITKSNPLVQSPAVHKVAQALDRIPFVAVFDLFLTPTAEAADLVLPVTSFLEDEDLITNSWHHYLTYAQPVIEPVGESRSDTDIFLDLAERLGCFRETKRSLLERVIAPLTEYGVTLEKLKKGPWRYPAPEVAWAGRRFSTTSGKFQFWDGTEAGFEYSKVAHRDPEYPYTLLSIQPEGRTHSQGGVLEADQDLIFYLHPQTCAREGLAPGQRVMVESATAQVPGRVQVDEKVHPQVILTYNGVWPKRVQEGLNALIPEKITSAGNQGAIYDSYCRISGR